MPYCINPECPNFRETGKFAEYVRGIEVCADCGAVLAPELPSDGRGGFPGAEAEPLVEVARMRQGTDLVVAMERLEKSGVEFMTKEHQADAVEPGQEEIGILVPRSQAAAAAEVVSGCKTCAAVEHEWVECSECGLAIDEDTTECPGCGAKFEKDRL